MKISLFSCMSYGKNIYTHIAIVVKLLNSEFLSLILMKTTTHEIQKRRMR